MSVDLDALDLATAAAAIAGREISSVALTEACLARIEALQPTLNAFIEVEREAALAAAAAADRAVAAGTALGPLHGVPLAHKDMYYRAGQRCTCGSRIRAEFVPSVTATVLDRLAGAGALHLGALNLSEFAASPTGHNAHWGDCCNPWDAARVPGGSSSGSGAAVATRQVFAALGSDTGGSIRIPAALCGVTGLKATYGRVSRAGVMPLSHSLDHVGPLALSARDCALILAVIAGPDPDDPTASPAPVPDYAAALEGGMRGLRVAVADNYFTDDLDPAVASAFADTLCVLTEAGAELVAVSLPEVDTWLAFATVVGRGEAASLHAEWLRTRGAEYTALVREFLHTGLGFSAVDYIQALRRRAAALAAFEAQALGSADILVVPTSPIPAPTRAATEVDAPGSAELRNRLSRFTRPFNYLGVPALAVPAGSDAQGLPVSVQFVGRAFDEAMVLRVGHAFQQATDWHRRVPAVAAAISPGSAA